MVLLERDLLALEAAAASTTTTEPTTSASTATEAATAAAVSKATAASTATSTAAAEATTAAAATSTAAVVWPAAGKVQADSTALKVGTLELVDNLLGILNGVEGDVTETLEPSGFPEEELARHKYCVRRWHDLLLGGQAKALDLRNLGEES